MMSRCNDVALEYVERHAVEGPDKSDRGLELDLEITYRDDGVGSLGRRAVSGRMCHWFSLSHFMEDQP